MHPPEAASQAPAHPLFRRLHRVEDFTVAGLFLLVTALPVLEMVLRTVLGFGVPGEAVIVQHFTFWAAFLGAMLCSREGAHLSLSTAELLPEGRPRQIARLGTNAVAAAVTGLFAFASLQMVIADSEGEQKIAGVVPEWWSEAVMPLALAVMTFRLVWRASPYWWGRAACLGVAALGFLLPWLGVQPSALLWPFIILIFVALLFGAPIYIAMSGLAMLFFYADDVPIAAVPIDTLRLAISPTLPAIPLLTAAGYVLSEGGAGKRLVALSRAILGWLPGGLAIVVCCVCAVFTAFTGGSGVTILAVGGLMLPMLVAEGYPEGFSLGLVTASGSLGLLFFPSMPVVLYGIVAQIHDTAGLFIAGFVPCVLMIVMVCLYGVFVGWRAKVPRHAFKVDEVRRTLWEAKWELGLPVVMVSAIALGWATIVEASALACVYAITTQVVIYKDIPKDKLVPTLVRAATLVGAVLIVLGVALGFTGYLIDAEVPASVIEWVKTRVDSQTEFLLVLNGLLLVLGSVLEVYSAVVVLAPLVAPLGEAFGVDRIHLAVVFLANLELGFLLPPVGLNLFLSASRFKKPLPQLYRHALPFLLIMTAGVLLVTYIPALTQGVLEALGYQGVPHLEGTP